MFCFSLLVIWLVNFHVHFGLLLSKRVHVKGSSEKTGTSTENFGGTDAPFAPLLWRACDTHGQ